MFKNTPVRTAMLELFTANPIPLSIAEILLKLEKMRLTPNKTTVYREIEFLMSLGRIVGVEFGDGKKRYEISKSHHHHIVCIKCGTVKDVRMEKDLLVEERKILKKMGFKPTSHSLEFFGLCKNCQNLEV